MVLANKIPAEKGHQYECSLDNTRTKRRTRAKLYRRLSSISIIIVIIITLVVINTTATY